MTCAFGCIVYEVTDQKVVCFQKNKGVKRKADTTTPATTPVPVSLVVAASSPFDPPFEPSGSSRPALIGSANRRGSHRQIKRPKKDLPEDNPQHSSKPKKRKLSVQLKYCSNLTKELFSKKHAVSIDAN